MTFTLKSMSYYENYKRCPKFLDSLSPIKCEITT